MELSLWDVWESLKDYMSKLHRTLLLIEHSWSNLLFFILELWEVYYLIHVHVPHYILIVGLEGLLVFPGAVVMEQAIGCCPGSKRWVTSSFYLALLAFSTWFVLVPEGPESEVQYMLILFGMNCFMEG